MNKIFKKICIFLIANIILLLLIINIFNFFLGITIKAFQALLYLSIILPIFSSFLIFLRTKQKRNKEIRTGFFSCFYSYILILIMIIVSIFSKYKMFFISISLFFHHSQVLFLSNKKQYAQFNKKSINSILIQDFFFFTFIFQIPLLFDCFFILNNLDLFYYLTFNIFYSIITMFFFLLLVKRYLIKKNK